MLARMRIIVMRLVGVPLGYLISAALRLTRVRAGIAVMYHRVGDPGGDPRAELVPSLASGLFESEVRYLARTYRLVRACELRDAILSRRRGERFPVAITFDDDDAAHVAVSAPILRRRGTPATFFLNGASLKGPSRFWWEALQIAVDRGLADERLLAGAVRPNDDIHELGLSVQMLPRAERARIVARIEEAVGPAPGDSGLRATHVHELADAGFEIGFHTLRHEFLPLLDDDALARAMRDGREELEEAAGSPLESIAYPHGGGEEREAQAARGAGFRWGFTTEPSAVTAATHPMRMGRVEATFDSVGRFALRLARALARAA
jgi:peptidoglycan/xylan/chitin deacetylase (PgdA/CDA1 family)